MSSVNVIDINIPTVATAWNSNDVWTHIKLRWGYGRSNSFVVPGLYAVGKPSANADVFATSNYTLSFNHLRRALHGLDAWILVLDTKGVNVWCAAGKGTFGTEELIRRVMAVNLSNVINHKRLIIPQLGATGISAHQIRKRIGYRVIYGPVRANDTKEFVANGYKASPQMRRVDFPLWERIKLIPVELIYGKYYLALIPLLFLVIGGLNPKGYSFELALSNGWKSTTNLLLAYLAGSTLTPILLPYIPLRSFALKGLVAGWLVVPLLFAFNSIGSHWLAIASWVLIVSGLSSFLGMNFTGSSTYTSLSGVNRELKLYLPVQIAMAGFGVVGWVLSLFISN